MVNFYDKASIKQNMFELRNDQAREKKHLGVPLPFSVNTSRLHSENLKEDINLTSSGICVV